MRSTSMRWWPLIATTLLGLAACTGAPEANARAARPSAPCTTETAAPAAGLLQVRQVWPDTTSVVAGFEAVSLDRAACEATGPAPAIAAPRCDRPFPWISQGPDQTYAMLGATGVARVYSATIRGHDPVPPDQVINPLEVRELVMVMRPTVPAADHPVAAAARACGTPMTGMTYTAYRTAVPSVNTDGNITALLAVAQNKLIWLEFDEIGWQERQYSAVLDLATADARHL
jgi:hypothetical protein